MGSCRRPWHFPVMLELRPICENCAKPLPPDATEAMICSFECTFCADCVAKVLHNVCPDWRRGNTVGNNPPVATVKHKPVDQVTHDAFAKGIGIIPPERR
jgi:uncharacterized protein